MRTFSKPLHELTTLEADGILYVYKHRKVLENIYLKIDKGNIVALFGRNGSGKSTLFEVIYGIKSPSYGSIRFNGMFVSKAYRYKNLISYLPQYQFVPTDLKVSDALRLFKCNLTEALSYFPVLSGFLPYRIQELSGGERRLVELILVMSSESSFLILDEPFSNVMPIYIETLKVWLVELKLKKGILLTDHSYENVLDIASRHYLINMAGRTIQMENPDKELRHQGYLR